MNQALATAEWADPDTFVANHYYEPGKFWLGRSPLNGEPLGYADDRHVCLVSGSRSGKGTTTIIPNLCLWPGSVVVVDPKGENATVTAARRGAGTRDCEGMGQAVHVLDPFKVAQVDDSVRARFNPLDILDPEDPRTIDDAGRIADAIVVINPETKDPFWDQSARALVKGLILHVLTDPAYEGRRNLVTIRQLIARGDHEGVALLREMGEENPAPPHALLWQSVAVNPAFNGVVSGIGETMANMAANSAKQFESVLQVANRNTEFLDSPGMQECVSASDFRLADLKTDRKGVSVFLSLPQRYMGEHFRWLRMMITLTINEMEAVPGQPASGHRVLLCLDEFAGLKRMEVIENAVAQSAGFGIKLFFVLQSLEQLKATYKDNWETFLSNAGLKLFYGLDDHFSRKYVSEFIGDTELLRELATSSQSFSEQTTHNTGTSSSKNWSNQEGTGYSNSDNWKSLPFFFRNTGGLFAGLSGKRQATRNRSTNTSRSAGGADSTQESRATMEGTTRGEGMNESLYKRPLITPDEVGRYFGRIDDANDGFYPGMGLTVITGSNPCPVHRVNYFEDGEFVRKYSAHPDHASAPPVDRKIELLPDGLWARIENHEWSAAEISDTGYRSRAVSRGEDIAVVRSKGDWLFYLQSPVNGYLTDVRGTTLSITTAEEPDSGVLRDNVRNAQDYAYRQLKEISEENRKSDKVDEDGDPPWVIIIPGIINLLIGGPIAYYSWPNDGEGWSFGRLVAVILGTAYAIAVPIFAACYFSYKVKYRDTSKPRNPIQRMRLELAEIIRSY